MPVTVEGSTYWVGLAAFVPRPASSHRRDGLSSQAHEHVRTHKVHSQIGCYGALIDLAGIIINGLQYRKGVQGLLKMIWGNPPILLALEQMALEARPKHSSGRSSDRDGGGQPSGGPDGSRGSSKRRKGNAQSSRQTGRDVNDGQDRSPDGAADPQPREADLPVNCRGNMSLPSTLERLGRDQVEMSVEKAARIWSWLSASAPGNGKIGVWHGPRNLRRCTSSPPSSAAPRGRLVCPPRRPSLSPGT